MAEGSTKIILIGNYPPDKQESMARFANMLETGFKSFGIETVTWRPVVFFASFHKTTVSGMGKWLGYIDKWLIFPMVLRFKLLNRKYGNPNVRFHICDHSNSIYLTHLPANRTAVTCHDVLAIRGALGYKDAFCEASRLGKVLQKWILRNLTKAKKIACVSNLTLKQLKEISPANSDQNRNWTVIHNAFNEAFKPVEHSEATKVLTKSDFSPGMPYLLHVGSSLPRKNRCLLLNMALELGNGYAGKLCFAGEAIDDELMKQAQKLGLSDRVLCVVKPDHATLTALYSACDAFIFPSFSEGFGWPIIEAQACGVPVIASNVEPLPEVSGGAAIHCSPYSPKEFANAYIGLKDKETREKLIEAGIKNAACFKSEVMIKDYVQLLQLPTSYDIA